MEKNQDSSSTSLDFWVGDVAFKMIKVEGGTFTMGVTPEQGEDAYDDEQPTHQVTLSDYGIGQFQVTQQLWEAVMGSNPSDDDSNPQNPVENVSWNDIVNDFLPKLNALTGMTFTLPTEAQWEFAARGGNKSEGYKYSGSNNIDDVAWFNDNSDNNTHPVGQKLPNELGLYDMSGNVEEWCRDWYGDYSSEAQTDPIRPVSGSDRVLRGGNCSDSARCCRVSDRGNGDPDYGESNYGFRLALSLNKDSLQLVPGQSETLIAGSNGIITSGITWTSSNLSVAEVDANGKVTAISSGSALITARVNSIELEFTCSVNVSDGMYLEVDGVGITMMKVEGGTFTMGATPEQKEDAEDDEQPAHQVTLSDYYIGRFQVTQELWEAVMGFNPSDDDSNPQNSVDNVSWNDIVNDFLPKLNALTGKNFTLPTEAQWEFAARGGNKSEGYKYSGSNNIDDVAWFNDNTDYNTYPVGQKLPNELGIYDMSGNVEEWCSDRYDDYSAEAQTDPIGPVSGSDRVLRGGNCSDSANCCRVSFRGNDDPDNAEDGRGFRLALSDIIVLNKDFLKLVTGQTETLIVSLNGLASFISGITWTSSNLSVAEVDANGKVTAICSGSALITARVNSIELLCNVNVSEGMYLEVDGVGITMMKVEGGTFTMGATPEQKEDAEDDEQPAHQVTLADYYIGQFQVTRELWETVMGYNPCDDDCNPEYAQYPVEMVSWNDVVNGFLPKLNELTGKNLTLPTEAQWEFASRGGNKSKGYKFSGSNNIDDVAWYDGNDSPYGTKAVGQKSPNELGIYDMSGNVREWCSDWYDDYSAEAQMDPIGPVSGSYRVMRGGYCSDSARYCRVSFRGNDDPHNAEDGRGFRLALSDIIVLNKDSLQLVPGQSETLIVGPNGIISLTSGITWTSSNRSVAEVDANGKVTAISSGSALITARVNSIELEFTCNVNVSDGMYLEVDGVEITMMKVEGGTFTMGATSEQGSDANDKEKPAHMVTLSDYYIGQIEVTQDLWQAVMGSRNEFKFSKKPVEQVSYNEIVNEFLPKLNKLTGKTFTLPTEAQWEFAARGGNKSEGYKYSGSNNLDEVAWYKDNNDYKTTYPVGQKLSNELGIYDMSGNVFEWCSDWYGDYSEEVQADPTGPASGSNRVLRGGSSDENARLCRVSDRNEYDPSDWSSRIGFRLALSDIIALNKVSFKLLEGQSETLIASQKGSLPLPNAITWSSSAESVASVDANGKVTAVGEGAAIITARVNETGQEVSCNVEVISSPKPSIVVKANGIEIPMMKVEGGTFNMGATSEQGADVSNDVKPAHEVTLSDYYIGQFQVTQELWRTVMGYNPSSDNGNPKNPVERVTWDDIVNDFLPKLNKLTGKTFILPTEAQWEFAARGGNKSKGYRYSGSNNPDEVAWYKDNSDYKTYPVGQKLPNELGIYDMSGNVEEWCSDWYDDYSAEAQMDPIGPVSGSYRVLRGGDHILGAWCCRVSHRDDNGPDSRSSFNGFRLVLSDIIVLNKVSFKLFEGQSETLIASQQGLLPLTSAITWSSSVESVASVDANGKVTAVGEGAAIITARVNETGKEVSCNVEVISSPKPSIVVKANGIEIPMIKVDGGTFTMGTTPEQGDDAEDMEKPAHQVTLSDYYIGQFQVTQELWMAVMGSNPSKFEGPKNPVDNVSWNDIVNDFLPKLNALTGKTFTLPTEAQWEFAARGGNKSQGYKYSGSNDLDQVAWYREDFQIGSTHPVGQKLPNELGIYDMSGNVFEWCSDWYYEYSREAQTDPPGPASDSYRYRVLRGGYYICHARFCRVSYRYFNSPDYRNGNYGFRLALSL